MTNVHLQGCRTEPLVSYLKALGAFRLLAEQRFPALAASWSEGALDLHGVEAGGAGPAVAQGVGGAVEGAIVEFFLDAYRPTPLLSPWNSRGGFRRDRLQGSEKLIAEVEATASTRLAPYRAAVSVLREVWQRAEAMGLVSDGRDPVRDKVRFVELCRAWVPDDSLAWLDASVVLTGDDATYPIVLGGTGGNLGAGDLSVNFIGLVLDLLGARNTGRAPSRERRQSWLRAALFDTGTPPLDGSLIGQFDPGGAGGVNMPGRGSIVNPWDLVLALEGAVLFAAGAARRLHDPKAAIPFTVAPTPVGYGSATGGENVKAELWLPEWQRPLTLAEVRQLLAEGRMQWGRRQARSALDVVRAVASLGTDRSVSRFHRYVVAVRLGQSNLAIPSGTIEVSHGGSGEAVDLLRRLDGWLSLVPRGDRASMAVGSLLRRVEAAQFDFALRPGAARLQRVLAELASLERAVARSPQSLGQVHRPVSGLSASDWLPYLDDGSAEFAIARGLASSRDRLPPAGRQLDVGECRASRLAAMVRPIELDRDRRRLIWSSQTLVPGLGEQGVDRVLVEVLSRRAVMAARHCEQDEVSDDVITTPGLRVAFELAVTVPLDAAAAFVLGEVDDRRLGELLAALSLLDFRGFQTEHTGWSAPARTLATDPLWNLLAVFFQPGPMRLTGGEGSPRRFWPACPPELVRSLDAGNVARVTRVAVRRLRQMGLEPLLTPHLRATRPHRVAAALALPLRRSDAARLLSAVCPDSPAPRADTREVAIP